MRVILSLAILLLITVVFENCACNYHYIEPKNVIYHYESRNNDLVIEYNPKILKETNRKRFSEKSRRKGVGLAAVKITNLTDKTLNFSEDIKLIRQDGVKLEILPTSYVSKALRQQIGWYLFYGLYVGFPTSSSGGGFIIGVDFIGLAIGVGNMIYAGSYNATLTNNLNNTSLNQKVIGPGETVYGIIGYNSFNITAIGAELKGTKKTTQAKPDSLAINNTTDTVSTGTVFNSTDKAPVTELDINQELIKKENETFDEYYNRITESIKNNPKARKSYEITKKYKTYKSGVVKETGLFIRNLDSYNSELRFNAGTWESYYPDGKIKSVENYDKSGRKVGKSIYYDETGKVVKEKYN